MFSSINTNLSSLAVANSLHNHFSSLATSTTRLSSGLRINSAADDAAGLAIRELMRADISALNQGVRNANDAISMIQTFDGALGIIDEKLIRMKELAEQAATGTYDSTQRLMIDSEFQAMGAEIDRIANATDFNGIKLIDGKFEHDEVNVTLDGSIKNTSYYVIGGQSIQRLATIKDGWNLDGITDSSLLDGEYDIVITNDYLIRINDDISIALDRNSRLEGDYDYRFLYHNGQWSINGTDQFGNFNGTNFYCQVIGQGTFWGTIIDNETGEPSTVDRNLLEGISFTWHSPPSNYSFGGSEIWRASPSYSTNIGSVTTSNHHIWATSFHPYEMQMSVDLDPIEHPGVNTISTIFDIENSGHIGIGEVHLILKVIHRDSLDDISRKDYTIPDDVVRIHFGEQANKREDFYDINKFDSSRKGLGLQDIRIYTQDSAQNALGSINTAIEEKDKIRAYLGAMQNRLENTISNLTIQAENLQIAETRISDADIATEMTNFVGNQILTQSAIAMLSQANSLPQMVMQLIK